VKPALALGAAAGAAAHACEPELRGSDLTRVESARYVLAYRSAPARIAVGEHFALELAVCGKDGAPAPESLQVDAHMPAHRHGMNYAPVVRRTAANRWRAAGLLLHMPGRWELRFDVRAGGAADRLTRNYDLD